MDKPSPREEAVNTEDQDQALTSQSFNTPVLVLDGKEIVLAQQTKEPAGAETVANTESTALVDKSVAALLDFINTARTHSDDDRDKIVSNYIYPLIALASYSDHPDAAQQLVQIWNHRESDKCPYFREKHTQKIAEALSSTGYQEAARELYKLLFTRHMPSFLSSSCYEIESQFKSALKTGNPEILDAAVSQLKQNFDSIRSYVKSKLLRLYNSPSDATELTDIGLEKFNAFMDEQSLDAELPQRVQGFMKKLEAAGDYTVTDDQRFFVEEPFSNYIENLYSDLQGAGNASYCCFNIATAIKDQAPQAAEELRGIGCALIELSLETAQGSAVIRPQQWAKDFSDITADPNTDFNEFVDQMERHPNCNKDFAVASEIYRPLNKAINRALQQPETFSKALAALYSMHPEQSQLFLYVTAIENFPSDSLPEAIQKHLQAWEKVLARTAEQIEEQHYIESHAPFFNNRYNDHIVQMARHLDTGSRPEQDSELHGVCSARTKMGLALLKHENKELQEMGKALLINLPDSNRVFFDLHMETTFEYRGSELNIQNIREFNPRQFKAYALIEAARARKELATSFLSSAKTLLDSCSSIEENLDDFKKVELRLSRQSELVAGLWEHGLPTAPEAHEKLANKLREMEEHLLQEQAWYNVANDNQRRERGYIGIMDKPEHYLDRLQLLKANLALRVSAIKARRQTKEGLAEEAQATVQEIFAATEKIDEVKYYDHVLLLETADILVSSPELKDAGKNIYQISIDRIGSRLKAEPDSIRDIKSIYASITSSSLTEDEQDEVLQNLLITLRDIGRKCLSDSYIFKDMIVSTIKSIGNNESYPKAKAETLRLAAHLTANNKFNKKDFALDNRDIAESLAALLEHMLEETM